MVGEEIIFNLVKNLLWINKKEGKEEKEDYYEEVVEKDEGCLEAEERIIGGCKKEGIEENGERKEEIIEGMFGGSRIEQNRDEKDMYGEGKQVGGIQEKDDWKNEIMEKLEECMEEDKENNWSGKEEDLEKMEEVLEGKKEAVGGLQDKEIRRKGEELWLEMWGKEMERREKEREKERKFMEIQKSQVQYIFLLKCLIQTIYNPLECTMNNNIF